MNLETLKIDLFKKGITKIKEGNFEEAKILFDASRTANELSISSALDTKETGIEAIKDDVPRETQSSKKETSKKDTSTKETKKNNKKDKSKDKEPVIENWEDLEPSDEEDVDVPIINTQQDEEDEVADTPDEFELENEEDEETEPEKVYAKDENGNDIDITYEYELLDGLLEKHRKMGALKLVNNNCVEIYEKLNQIPNFTDKVKKVRIATIIGAGGIKKCNKKVSDITSGLSSNIYEWINDENVDVFLKKK